MRIAILGATSMLAADFVAFSLEQQAPYSLTLFARDPDAARDAITRRMAPALGVSAPPISALPDCQPLDAFADGDWDAIVNFVGVGDPARAVAMGANILRITRLWDDRVLAYLDTHPACRYVFLSSGAAFGATGAEPLGPDTSARFAINDLQTRAYYGISKFYAEAVHRSQTGRSIVDIRIFNYISEFADLNHRFLINEMIAAVRDGRSLSVDPNDMWRDYLGTEDFAALMGACLDAPSGYNAAVDAYSRSAISKMQMLALFRDEFGLVFEVSGGGINATGVKSNYFSRNRSAEALGYRPRSGSSDTLKSVTRLILSR